MHAQPLLNPDRRESIVHIGKEKQPILVLDDAFADPHALRASATNHSFGAVRQFFPGVSAQTTADFDRALITELGPSLEELYGEDAHRLVGQSFFSLVCAPPEQLAPIQCLPHYDGVHHDQFAAIAYLFDTELGGTAFFRHCATGFETVTADRFEAYRDALQADVNAHGLPPKTYMTDGAPLFERIELVEARWNRLVAYRGVQLHSGLISDPGALSADPSRGRLTLTSFFKRAGGR